MNAINRHVDAAPAPAPGINDAAASYERLLDLGVLSTWTLDRQRAHAADTSGYAAALAAFQTALRSEVVDGDGRLSAGRRARKVEKHLKALVRASQKAEAAAEQLRLSYAAHKAHIKALPGQRQAKAAKRAGRREALTEVTQKSMHKTASAFVQAPAEAPPAPAEQPAASVRGIADLWAEQQRRGA